MAIWRGDPELRGTYVYDEVSDIQDSIWSSLGVKPSGSDTFTPPDIKAKRNAAATAVAREIVIAYEEDEENNAGTTGMDLVSGRQYQFTMKTADGWKRITMPPGTRFTWAGAARASANGKVLFGLKPDDDIYLHKRGVSVCEVPHDELDKVFGEALTDWVALALGMPIDAMIKQAMAGHSISARDIEKAEAMPEEKEAPVDETQSMEDWGAWA